MLSREFLAAGSGGTVNMVVRIAEAAAPKSDVALRTILGCLSKATTA
jgi:hypothetical protein